MAAMNGYLDCFKKLVALMPNFNVDCVDELGRSCLHTAACGGLAVLFVLFFEFIEHIIEEEEDFA